MDSLENYNKNPNQGDNEDCFCDDDPVELPPDTLAILNEFLQNKDKKKASECDMLEEDWVRYIFAHHFQIIAYQFISNFFLFQQLSQFWYNEATKHLLSRLCLELVLKKQKSTGVEHVKVALLSCPSIYRSVKNVIRETNTMVRLFEFDTRFSIFGEDFVFYDYRDVVQNEKTLIKSFGKSFDIIFADPPFLSEECIVNMADIIKKIMKDDADVIVCSGKIMELSLKNTLNLNKCEFQPEHQRNLANEFCSFANFDLDSLLKCLK